MTILFLLLLLRFCFNGEDTKYSRQCFIGYPNTLNFVKNTPQRVVFSTLFSVFGYSNETLPLVFDTLLLILRIHIAHYIKDDFMPAMMQFSSFEQQSTYYDENDKINPVPKAMRVLNIIHDICPALECDHLYTQGNNKKLQVVSCINRYNIQTAFTNTTK